MSLGLLYNDEDKRRQVFIIVLTVMYTTVGSIKFNAKRPLFVCV